MHGLNHARRRSLDRGNLLRDVAGCLLGLRRERLDLLRDHGKTATGRTGTRRLDRCIEREQIGLRGDVANEIADAVDLSDRRRQAFHRRYDRPCLRRRPAGDIGGFRA